MNSCFWVDNYTVTVIGVYPGISNEDIISRVLNVAKGTLLATKHGYHAGLAQKWVGPFEVDQRLINVVYSLMTFPPVKVSMQLS